MNDYVLSYDGDTARIAPKLPDIFVDRLQEILSYEPVGAEFAPTHQRNLWRTVNGKRQRNSSAKWDGRIKLFKKGRGAYNHFPTGLIPRALQGLQDVFKGNLVISPPARVMPDRSLTLDGKQVVLKNKPTVLQMRDYGREVVEALLNAPHGRGMAESPTGSGKSIIMAELICKFPDVPILVTVPSRSLMYQTRADFEAVLGEKVGILGDSETDLQRVTVAIIDSLAAAVKPDVKKSKRNKKGEIDPATAKPRRPEIVAFLAAQRIWILDEHHLSAADRFTDVSPYLINALNRYAVSATLWREDGADMVLEGIAGQQVIRIEPMRLIQEGWLATPNIEMHIIDHDYTWTGEGKKPRYDWVYDQRIVHNDFRNDYITEQAHRCLKEGQVPCLILVKDIEHGNLLQELLSYLGRTAFLFGEDDQKVRTAVLKQVQDGTLPFLVASTIFDVGVDIPELKSVILAGAGKSASRAIQRVGRGLRKTQPKDVAETVRIIDFEDREPYYLESHSAERRRRYDSYYPGCVSSWLSGQPLPTSKWF